MKILRIALVFWSFFRAVAQEPAQTVLNDTLDLDRLALIIRDNDSLRRIDSIWYHSFLPPNTGTFTDSIAVAQADLDTAVFRQRLRVLNARSPVNIVYHPALEKTVRRYLRNKAFLEKIFGLAEYYYFPMFEEALAKENIPLEVKFLPIVESRLNPSAVSPAGAAGLWQFMYFTGKKYGLEMTSYLDERFSPELSTRAAVLHLKDLYALFKDWNLVLAAYNSGPGNVTRAIRRSGGYKNYWNLRPYLPRETANYVPQFLALWFLYEYRNEYGIIPRPPDTDYMLTDTVHVKKHVSFEQISKVFPVSRNELKFLNPAYKLEVVPYVPGKHYTLRLPYRVAQLFTQYEKDFYAAVEKDWNKREKPLPKFYTLPDYVIYTVREGDYLGKIARRYGTSVAKIKRWNHLRSSRIRVGQKLKIYSRRPAITETAKMSHTKSPRGPYFYHTVQKGDTLWDISRKYHVSVRDLMRWNGMKSKKLTPGKKLKIYKS